MCSHIKYINFLVNKRRYNFLISKACVRDASAILNSVAGIFSESAVKTDDMMITSTMGNHIFLL